MKIEILKNNLVIRYDAPFVFQSELFFWTFAFLSLLFGVPPACVGLYYAKFVYAQGTASEECSRNVSTFLSRVRNGKLGLYAMVVYCDLLRFR